MRSDLMKKGTSRIAHRALMKATGLTDEEISRPIIGVVNSQNEFIPGHIHLDTIAEAVKAGIRMAGGTPIEFPAIGVCDGIAMNHDGMHFSLPSREHIADSVEIMATAHPVDGIVFIPNCDKIVPGMLMAALRLNVDLLQRRPHASRKGKRKSSCPYGRFRGSRSYRGRQAGREIRQRH